MALIMKKTANTASIFAEIDSLLNTLQGTLRKNKGLEEVSLLNEKINELKNILAAPLAEEIDLIYNKQYEKNVLNSLNLNAFVEFIKKENLTENCNIIGHYAEIFKEILNSSCRCLNIVSKKELSLCENPQSYVCPDNLEATFAIAENYIVTNTCLSDFLAVDNSIQNVYTSIKNKLMLLTSPEKKENIEVLWSDGFFAPEIDNNRYFRWCTDNSAENNICIKNNTNSQITAKISFAVNSAMPNTFLEININGNIIKHNFSLGMFIFEQEINLIPNDNYIKFSFVGECLVVENDPRKFYYRIEDLQVSSNNLICANADAYVDKKSIKLPYSCVSDYIMRKNLHKNGFFEVVSYNVLENGSIEKCETSRFISNVDSFQVINEAQKTSPHNFRIYIAKRKGEYENVN